jgi:Ca2+-transporting ATPase
MMSTVHDTADGIVQYTKGAPDNVLQHCTHYIKDGKQLPMTDGALAEILAANKGMADRALRVLAGAFRTHGAAAELDYEPDALERELCFIGLAGMSDPVRPEVKDAIDKCRGAGIRPIMITGDHVDTASAIARELGILGDGDAAVTGSQLEDMDDEEFERRFRGISVYARVQPEHKVRIVSAWRDAGFVTAMTGDGVNDAPSIKTADIGVGMGITGTDVTKNVADMVLADDNFATIVGAVEEGRRIYDNIRRVMLFLFSSNLSEVLGVFTASLLGFVILQPVHLLWINLVTDCFPALALGMEKPEHDIMAQQPRKAKDGIFSGGVGFDVCYQGVLVTLLTTLAYFIGEFLEAGHWAFTGLTEEQAAQGMTMAFLTMSMCEIFHSFNMRSQRGSVITMTRKSGSNLWLWGSMLVSLLLTSTVVFVPFLREAFSFAAISMKEYGIAMALAVSVIPIVEIVKLAQRKWAKR